MLRRVTSPLNLTCYPAYAFVHSALCLLVFDLTSMGPEVLSSLHGLSSKITKRHVRFVNCAEGRRNPSCHLSTYALESMP